MGVVPAWLNASRRPSSWRSMHESTVRPRHWLPGPHPDVVLSMFIHPSVLDQLSLFCSLFKGSDQPNHKHIFSFGSLSVRWIWFSFYRSHFSLYGWAKKYLEKSKARYIERFILNPLLSFKMLHMQKQKFTDVAEL